MMHQYTHIHFHVEESFLEKTGAPDAKRHHKLHRDLSQKLADAGKICLMDKDPYLFLDFLKTWWLDHICYEDLIYRDYFDSLAKKQHA
jgi:hemerythrin-like metal-binding protein